MREGVGPKRLDAGQPKVLYVTGGTSRMDDGLGQESSRLPGTFGSRCRVICGNEQIPSDF